MNLIALFLGLAGERLLTRLFHLREPRWFDTYFDWGLGRLGSLQGPFAYLAAILLGLLPVLPVAAVTVLLWEVLHGWAYVMFSVVVLFFSFGPRDLGREVNDYIQAVESGDKERARQVAKELIEHEAPRESGRRERAIEEAICVQANNRIFGVILWFMILGPLLLGPLGAWVFRVTDLMRRRAVFESTRDGVVDDAEKNYLRAVQILHGALAWLPARLLAVGYALAGSFEDAISDWRSYYQDCADNFFHVNDDVVACAGSGALRPQTEKCPEEENPEVRAAHSAMRLVYRTLVIWVTVISLLTLVGLAV